MSIDHIEASAAEGPAETVRSAGGASVPGERDIPSVNQQRSLQNRVNNLLALIVVPTIAAVVLGGLRIADAASSAVALKRTTQLAVLNGDIIRLAQSMEDERDLTAGWIADGRPTGTAAIYTALLHQQDTTDEAVQQISGDANNIGPTYSSAIRSAFRRGSVTSITCAAPRRRPATSRFCRSSRTTPTPSTRC